jgi:hypothetical protein
MLALLNAIEAGRVQQTRKFDLVACGSCRQWVRQAAGEFRLAIPRTQDLPAINAEVDVVKPDCSRVAFRYDRQWLTGVKGCFLQRKKNCPRVDKVAAPVHRGLTG